MKTRIMEHLLFEITMSAIVGTFFYLGYSEMTLVIDKIIIIVVNSLGGLK